MFKRTRKNRRKSHHTTRTQRRSRLESLERRSLLCGDIAAAAIDDQIHDMAEARLHEMVAEIANDIANERIHDETSQRAIELIEQQIAHQAESDVDPANEIQAVDPQAADMVISAVSSDAQGGGEEVLIDNRQPRNLVNGNAVNRRLAKEADKQDAGKQDAGKQDAGKQDAGKQNAKQNAAKADPKAGQGNPKLDGLKAEEQSLKDAVEQAEKDLEKAKQEEIDAKNKAETAAEEAKKTAQELEEEDKDKLNKLRQDRAAAHREWMKAIRAYLKAKAEYEEWSKYYRENPDAFTPGVSDKRLARLKAKMDEAKDAMEKAKDAYEVKKNAANQASKDMKQKDYKQQVKDNKQKAQDAKQEARDAEARRKAAERKLAEAKAALKKNKIAQEQAAAAQRAEEQKKKDAEKAQAQKEKAEREAAERRRKEAEERAKRIRKAVKALKYLGVIPEHFNAEPYISNWIGSMSLVGADATTGPLNLGTVLGGLQAAYGIVNLEFLKLIPSNTRYYQQYGQQRLEKWLQDKGYAKDPTEAKQIREEMEAMMGVKSVTSTRTYK